ncbi:YibE/F family protein [Candidatus Roizmanbacteria bacterium]|nr:YibE/F family protein [Candidatus Roizmanbacteria bacterium]
MKIKKFLILIIFLFLSSIFLNKVNAQTNVPKQESLEATVTMILVEKQITPKGGVSPQLYQKLELMITKGSLENKKIIIESGNYPLANLQKYNLGDKVVVLYSKDFKGNDNFFITDFIRRDALLWLFIIFILLTIIIAKWRGLLSLVGMVISFLIIFLYILPNISSGLDPIQIAITGSLFIIPVTFYFSHGFNKKTTVAIMGTIITLIITGLLANFFVNFSKLTGFASEEAGFLEVAKQGTINMKGLLLAGIIIGVLGVLDDITVSQSAIVFQLKEINSKLKFDELYSRAMNIGQDHISSMVNTLILVYTGAALPLLILFINNPHPLSEVINYEMIADEIVRTLVGSIGLILSVPITTFIASMVASKKQR